MTHLSDTPPNIPQNPLIRIWRCWIQRPQKWLLARAASKLAVYAWNTGNNDLWLQMIDLHNDLWAEVYAEENNK